MFLHHPAVAPPRVTLPPRPPGPGPWSVLCHGGAGVPLRVHTCPTAPAAQRSIGALEARVCLGRLAASCILWCCVQLTARPVRRAGALDDFDDDDEQDDGTAAPASRPNPAPLGSAEAPGSPTETGPIMEKLAVRGGSRRHLRTIARETAPPQNRAKSWGSRRERCRAHRRHTATLCC